MKKIINLFFLIISVQLQAQIKGKIIDTKGNYIEGVKIYWLGTNTIAKSNHKGEFSLVSVPITNKIIFSKHLYNNDTITVLDTTKFIVLTMKMPIQLSEVAVVARNSGVVKSKTAIFQTEKITGAELCKAACCNLSESFETNPSVDVSYSDAATGAKQIKLLGLSGAYVQMLTENTPGLRGLASVYGLGFVPGPWMESIQVSKGTASVINGYEAITGQINVEYKKPNVGELASASLYANDNGRTEASATASAKLSPYLSTAILLHSSYDAKKIDLDQDGYMDMPMITQYNIINRWHYKKGNYVSQLFLRALSENRMGGQSAGNYKVGVDTKRYEFSVKNGYVFNPEAETSMGFIVSGSLHNQNSNYGFKTYNGDHNNLYANLIFQTSFGSMSKISTGASVNADMYKESVLETVSTNFEKQEFIHGVFAEYTLNLNDKLIALAGLRADNNVGYGTFITPRMHLKYNVADYLHLRASAGKGYRPINIWAENNFLLASNRQITIDTHLKMESAWNYGCSAMAFIPVSDKKLNITGEWYYTNFEEQVVLDVDSDPHKATFSSLNGKSYANNFQLEANMELFRGFTATVAHRITDAKTTIQGKLTEKPLLSRYKSMITTSYQTPLKKWQFDFTAQFNGGGRMPKPSTDYPLWNDEYQSFTILNAQISKYFRTWFIYFGVENLTNVMQSNPIIDVQNPYGNNFDATMVWGPMNNRKFYAGIRWALDRD